MISLNDYSFGYWPVSPIGQFKQSLEIFVVTDSPLSVTNIAELAMFRIKVTSLRDFSLEEGLISPTCLFKQSLDSCYVTGSPLRVTNTAKMAMFYIRTDKS